jgi:succinyl-diaminopimelate desuccinylase
MSNTLDLAIDLIARRSITPEDGGCQDVIGARLKALGFAVEALKFEEVKNLWATHGSGSPVLVFAGHTDVVPPGPEGNWQTPPFQPTLRNGCLFGRGAADMKGGLAAMVVAAENFLRARKMEHKGTIAFLITSDEEGTGVNGTRAVVRHLQERKQAIDYCIVGEATSVDTVGDTIKNGRRGSMTGTLTVHGVQGHVAYPERAVNPIHACGPLVSALVSERWDEGNEFFSPTSLQISNIHAGTGADNVIPGSAELLFNFRFSSAVTADELKRRTEAIVQKHGLKYDLSWRVSGEPFLTKPGDLIEAASKAIQELAGVSTELSTSGGTSDARFIAPMGAQVVELGPVNASIHKVNECVVLADLDKLTEIYENVLQRLL